MCHLGLLPSLHANLSCTVNLFVIFLAKPERACLPTSNHFAVHFIEF